MCMCVCVCVLGSLGFVLSYFVKLFNTMTFFFCLFYLLMALSLI